MIFTLLSSWLLASHWLIPLPPYTAYQYPTFELREPNEHAIVIFSDIQENEIRVICQNRLTERVVYLSTFGHHRAFFTPKYLLKCSIYADIPEAVSYGVCAVTDGNYKACQKLIISRIQGSLKHD